MDDTIPLHCFDNTQFLRSMVMNLTVRFDNVLDTQELHRSLLMLVNGMNWRKLSGGLHQFGFNGFNIRVVNRVDPYRPPVNFSEAHYHMPMKDHPLVASMMHTTPGPSIHPGVEQLRPLYGDGSGPTCFKDFITQKLPQISVHVTTFDDGTLMSITWPHTLTDGPGWAHIFQAWCALSANRFNTVPRFMGYDMDTLAEFGFDEDVHRSVLEPEGRNLSAVPCTIATQLVNAFHEPKLESRVFCIPDGTLKQIQLKTVSTKSSPTSVNETDIIKGWASNVICSHMGTSNRQVCIQSFFDLRERLPCRFPVQGCFVQNAMLPYVTQIAAKDMVHGHFGDTAAAIRESAILQGRPEQLAATARLLRISGMRDKYQVLGDPNGLHVYFLDWSSSRLLENISFPEAVEESMQREADGDAITPADKGQKGKAVYFQTDIVSRSELHGQDVFTLYGRDPEGNFWFGAVLHKKEMKNLEEEIERLQRCASP